MNLKLRCFCLVLFLGVCFSGVSFAIPGATYTPKSGVDLNMPNFIIETSTTTTLLFSLSGIPNFLQKNGIEWNAAIGDPKAFKDPVRAFEAWTDAKKVYKDIKRLSSDPKIIQDAKQDVAFLHDDYERISIQYSLLCRKISKLINAVRHRFSNVNELVNEFRTTFYN